MTPEDDQGAVPTPASDIKRGAAEVARLVLLLDPYGTGDWATGTTTLLDEVAGLPPEKAYSLLACAVLMIALETPVPRLPAPTGHDVDLGAVRRLLAGETIGEPEPGLDPHGQPHAPERSSQHMDEDDMADALRAAGWYVCREPPLDRPRDVLDMN